MRSTSTSKPTRVSCSSAVLSTSARTFARRRKSRATSRAWFASRTTCASRKTVDAQRKPIRITACRASLPGMPVSSDHVIAGPRRAFATPRSTPNTASRGCTFPPCRNFAIVAGLIDKQGAKFMRLMPSLRVAVLAAALFSSAAIAASADLPGKYWGTDKTAPILDKTITLRLAPDLDALSDAERKALDELLATGRLLHELYLEQQH